MKKKFHGLQTVVKQRISNIQLDTCVYFSFERSDIFIMNKQKKLPHEKSAYQQKVYSVENETNAVGRSASLYVPVKRDSHTKRTQFIN